MKHCHINMDGPKQTRDGRDLTNFASDDELKKIGKQTRELFNYLVENEEKVLLHCAAGLHRTGMISYTLLRHSGLDKK
jgi:protein tyrosine/serine phosphatase